MTFDEALSFLLMYLMLKFHFLSRLISRKIKQGQRSSRQIQLQSINWTPFPQLPVLLLSFWNNLLMFRITQQILNIVYLHVCTRTQLLRYAWVSICKTQGFEVLDYWIFGECI